MGQGTNPNTDGQFKVFRLSPEVPGHLPAEVPLTKVLNPHLPSPICSWDQPQNPP